MSEANYCIAPKFVFHCAIVVGEGGQLRRADYDLKWGELS